jgi:HlyD family secretion protein
MFKFLLKALIVLGALAAIGYFAYPPIARQIAERNKPRWRLAAVETGSITYSVNATGKVKPVKSVQVGSFVSGPIKELFVKFNQPVKKDELMARIDPRLFAATVAQNKAALDSRKADLKRVEALLQQAVNDEQRAASLKKRNEDFIAQAEMDVVKFNRMSLEAQLAIAKASIEQAEAALSNSQANLDFTEIRAPEDGIIIDRKVEPGQTLAAGFTTPELFVVGVGLREKMLVFADVDESEIGLIRTAAIDKRPVSFTVDAYPDDLFKGEIEEVRFSSTTTQNVVTYPVVVGVANPDLKLLPGMTANLSFQVGHVENVTKIPKMALRFYPASADYVHPDDRGILDGVMAKPVPPEDAESAAENEDAAPERIAVKQSSRKRHVWYVDGEFLRAIEVTIGISDNRFAELVTGEIKPGIELVVGQKAKGEM